MVKLTLASALFLLGAVGSALSYKNTVYLIRHGEKPADGGIGLTERGEQRAKCIAELFGKRDVNIGLILAQTPKKSGKRARPSLTVAPLAKALKLKVDVSCGRDDSKCVADVISKFAESSKASVLVCWEHKALEGIQKSMGIKEPKIYPSKRFDRIFTVQDGKIQVSSEKCHGLDDAIDGHNILIS